MLHAGEIVKLGDKYLRVEFVNASRALVVPLAVEPKTIRVRDGEGNAVEKVINRTTDGDGFNISPNSPLDVIPLVDLPERIRRKLEKR